MGAKNKNNEICQKFGQAVSSRRHALGLSQEELANRTGLHRTYIADIERGERNIGLRNIIRLAEGLRVSPAQLFSIYGAWSGERDNYD